MVEWKKPAGSGETVRFCVYGVPVGKGRPRFTKSGHTYTPEKTAAYEETVRLCWKTQSGKRFSGNAALLLSVTAYFPIPKSFSRKKAAELDGEFHIKKPDADNVAKAVMDALNGLAYPDDAVVQIDRCHKRYTNAAPRVEVSIREAGHEL